MVVSRACAYCMAVLPHPTPSGFRPRIGVRGMPSIAGMTRWGAGMTLAVAGMTVGTPRMTLAVAGMTVGTSRMTLAVAGTTMRC